MLKELTPPADALTADALCTALGPGFQVAPGIVLRREWQNDGETVRLDLQHQQGTSFLVRVEVGGQPRWQGSFTLRDFPGPTTLIKQVLAGELRSSAPAPAPTPAPAAPAASASWDHSDAPVVGEIWVMSIQRLEASDSEVRYVTINRDGEQFGAPRVLPRQDFERLFMAVSAAFYRLVVRVLAVADGQVQYQHLDAQRQPASEPRTIDLPAFVATFLAEAAAY